MLNNNDVLRSIRYTLDLPNAKIAEMIKLTDDAAHIPDIAQLLTNEEDEGFIPCEDTLLVAFLDGLITYQRGARDTPIVPTKRLTNNLIFKKIRIAFNLKEDDLHAIIKLADFEVSRPELSAVFRKPDNKNYRQCGDQLLRYFLKGLSLHCRGS